MEEFGKIPKKDEIRAAIKKMKYDKALGATGLSIDMVKTLSDDAMDFLTKAIREFWSY
jgi:hypothetical protein